MWHLMSMHRTRVLGRPWEIMSENMEQLKLRIKPDRMNAWSTCPGTICDANTPFWGVGRMQIMKSMQIWVKGWELIMDRDTKGKYGAQVVIFYLCEGEEKYLGGSHAHNSIPFPSETFHGCLFRPCTMVFEDFKLIFKNCDFTSNQRTNHLLNTNHLQGSTLGMVAVGWIIINMSYVSWAMFTLWTVKL